MFSTVASQTLGCYYVDPKNTVINFDNILGSEMLSVQIVLGASWNDLMFRSANARLNFRPKEGDKVLMRGNLSLYEPRGDYQLIADYIEPDGIGAMKADVERLKLQ